MARMLSRSPSETDEHAYYEWAKKFLWNDRRCDYCERLLPDDDIHRHNVYDMETGIKIPNTVYCSEECYTLNRAAGNCELTTDIGFNHSFRPEPVGARL